MIRSSPCDFYLKYLLTHPDKYREDQIRRLVKLQQLDFLGMPHLRRLKERCVAPSPFYPEDLTHRPSQRFLQKERIFSLYHMDDDSICAAKLLDHARGKEMAESLILTDAEPLWVCGMLKKIGFKATPRSIELYKHYYFNTELVDRTEIQAIMLMRAEVDNENDEDATRFKRHYWRAAKEDQRRLSVNAGFSPLSRAMNLMRLGFMPNGVDIARVATVGRMAAVIQSTGASLSGRSKAAMDFALTAKMLTEMMESTGDASGEFQQSLMKMVLDTDASPVPTLEQLTKGDHTLDLIPKHQSAPMEAELTEDEDDVPA